MKERKKSVKKRESKQTNIEQKTPKTSDCFHFILQHSTEDTVHDSFALSITIQLAGRTRQAGRKRKRKCKDKRLATNDGRMPGPLSQIQQLQLKLQLLLQTMASEHGSTIGCVTSTKCGHQWHESSSLITEQ